MAAAVAKIKAAGGVSIENCPLVTYGELTEMSEKELDELSSMHSSLISFS